MITSDENRIVNAIVVYCIGAAISFILAVFSPTLFFAIIFSVAFVVQLAFAVAFLKKLEIRT